jgi:hypothetical protein
MFGRNVSYYLPGVDEAGLLAVVEAGLLVLLEELFVLFLVCGFVLLVFFCVALVADGPEGDAALLVA